MNARRAAGAAMSSRSEARAPVRAVGAERAGRRSRLLHPQGTQYSAHRGLSRIPHCGVDLDVAYAFGHDDRRDVEPPLEVERTSADYASSTPRWEDGNATKGFGSRAVLTCRLGRPTTKRRSATPRPTRWTSTVSRGPNRVVRFPSPCTNGPSISRRPLRRPQQRRRPPRCRSPRSRRSG
jgi:hypothetical protein